MKLSSTNAEILAYNGTGKALIKVGKSSLFLDEKHLEELWQLIRDMEEFNRNGEIIR